MAKEIIKPGKRTHKLAKCEQCECEFIFKMSDINASTQAQRLLLTCPDCLRIIKSFTPESILVQHPRQPTCAPPTMTEATLLQFGAEFFETFPDYNPEVALPPMDKQTINDAEKWRKIREALNEGIEKVTPIRHGNVANSPFEALREDSIHQVRHFFIDAFSVLNQPDRPIKAERRGNDVYIWKD